MTGRSLAPPLAQKVGRWGLMAWCAACVSVGCLAVATLTLAQHFPLVDMLTPFTGHLWGVSLAGAFAVLAPKRQIATFCLSILAILFAHGSMGHVGTWLSDRATSSEGPAAPPFKVVLLNTWHDHAKHDVLAAFLAGSDADVIVLTETGPDKLPLLDSLKRRYPYQIHCAAQWRCSLALLSKHPIEAGAAVRDHREQAPIAIARLAAPAGEQSVTIIGTHVHRPTRNPYLHQMQMERLASIVGTVAGPVIVAGDFNAVPWSASLRKLRAVTGLKPHANMMPTWPATSVGLPQFAFDHVFVSQDLDVRSARLGPSVGSDHYPVIVELAPVRRVGAPPAAPGSTTRRRNLHTTAPSLLLAQVVADFPGKHHAP